MVRDAFGLERDEVTRAVEEGLQGIELGHAVVQQGVRVGGAVDVDELAELHNRA